MTDTLKESPNRHVPAEISVEMRAAILAEARRLKLSNEALASILGILFVDVVKQDGMCPGCCFTELLKTNGIPIHQPDDKQTQAALQLVGAILGGVPPKGSEPN